MDVLYTPDASVQVINRVKDSKFYGSISTAAGEEEVKAFIKQIKEQFPDATHNVSAYKLGSGDQAVQYDDDDGEPAGSSGPPVLQAIEGAGLTNTVIVITRYFGGTKLGIGGLIRAYGDTARLAIKEAGRKRLIPLYRAAVEGSYEQLGTILGQVEAFSGLIEGVDYDESGGRVRIVIRPADYESLRKILIEKTGNRAEIQLEEEFYRPEVARKGSSKER